MTPRAHGNGKELSMANQAKFSVDPELLRNLLFPGLDAKIVGVTFTPAGIIDFDIAGADVPKGLVPGSTKAVRVRNVFSHSFDPKKPGVTLAAKLEVTEISEPWTPPE
jgi:hypothetical protein